MLASCHVSTGWPLSAVTSQLSLCFSFLSILSSIVQLYSLISINTHYRSQSNLCEAIPWLTSWKAGRILQLVEMPLRKPPKTLLNISLDALVKHLSSYITRWHVCKQLTSLTFTYHNFSLSESLERVASSLTFQKPQSFSWQSEYNLKVWAV